MKKQYGDPMFYKLLNEIAELHSDKNHDYADNNSLSNFMFCEQMGIPAWKGALVRMKIGRASCRERV